MTFVTLVKYLHMALAFTYVGATLAAHWNTLSARRKDDWRERAALFETNRLISMAFALGALIGTGLVGNVLAMQLGFRMGSTRVLQIVNGLWVIMVLVSIVIEIPLSTRLAAVARSAANNTNREGGAARGGQEPVDWPGALGRWRIGNALQLLLFFIMLWFMASPWKH